MIYKQIWLSTFKVLLTPRKNFDRVVKDQNSRHQIKSNGQPQITAGVFQGTGSSLLETLEVSEVFDPPKSTKRYKSVQKHKKWPRRTFFEDFKCAVGYFTSGRTHLNIQGNIYPVIIDHEIHQRAYFVIDTSYPLLKFCVNLVDL